MAVRLIMGLLEAGLFPGLVTYLTMFYSRDQLAVRVGYLFVSSAIAGAIGGIIAYGIGEFEFLLFSLPFCCVFLVILGFDTRGYWMSWLNRLSQNCRTKVRERGTQSSVLLLLFMQSVLSPSICRR